METYNNILKKLSKSKALQEFAKCHFQRNSKNDFKTNPSLWFSVLCHFIYNNPKFNIEKEIFLLKETEFTNLNKHLFGIFNSKLTDEEIQFLKPYFTTYINEEFLGNVKNNKNKKAIVPDYSFFTKLKLTKINSLMKLNNNPLKALSIHIAQDVMRYHQGGRIYEDADNKKVVKNFFIPRSDFLKRINQDLIGKTYINRHSGLTPEDLNNIMDELKPLIDESLEERLGLTRRGFLKSAATIGAGALLASQGIDMLMSKEAQGFNILKDLHIYCGNPAIFTMYFMLIIHDFVLPKKYMIILNRPSDPGRAPGTPTKYIKAKNGFNIIKTQFPSPGRAPAIPRYITNINGDYDVDIDWPGPGRAPGTPKFIIDMKGNYDIKNDWPGPERAPGIPKFITKMKGNYDIKNDWPGPGRAPGTPIFITKLQGNYDIKNDWPGPERAPGTPILVTNLQGDYDVKNTWPGPGRAPGTPCKIIFTDSKEEVIEYYPHLKDKI